MAVSSIIRSIVRSPVNAIVGQAGGGGPRTFVIPINGQSNEIGFANASGDLFPANCYHWTHAGALESLSARSQIDYVEPVPSTISPWISFATLWLAAHPDDTLIFVGNAKSGTGYTGAEWSDGGTLKVNAVSRTLAALAASPGATLLCAFGVPGEAPAVADPSTMAAKTDELITDFRASVSAPNLPWVVCGIAQDYVTSASLTAGQAVLAATPTRLPYTAFINTVTPTELDTTDGVHFDRAGTIEKGNRAYPALLSAIAAVPQVPGQVTGLNATSGSSEVSLVWTAPAASHAAITDYVIQFSLDGSTGWTTISDGTSTSTSYTHTGRTNGVEYWYRVAAVSSVGQGSYSATDSAIPASSPFLDLLALSPAVLIDVSQAGSCYQERTSQTTEATADGDPVGTLKNWGTLGGFIQFGAADAGRPTLRISGATKYLEFDGTDDISNNMTSLYPDLFRNVGSGQIAAVYKWRSSPATSKFVVNWSRATTASSRAALFGGTTANKYGAGGRRQNADSQVNVASSASIGTTDPVCHLAEFDWTNSNLTQYINNSVDGSTTSFSTDGVTDNTASNSVSMGGAGGFSDINLYGLVAEDAFLNRATIQTWAVALGVP